MKMLQGLWVGALVTMLAACGGGGGSAGTVSFGGAAASSASSPASAASSPASAAAVVATVDVLSSAIQIGSGGDQATVTAIVKDQSNVALSGVAVAFSADSGTLVTTTSTTTDATGSVTALFSAGQNKANRKATISATAGSVTGTIALQVVGTVLSNPSSAVVALSQSAPVSIKAVDSKGLPISGLAISVASTLGNTLSAPTITTDTQGAASVTYTAAKAGSDTVTFTGGGASVTASVSVSGENFVFTSPAAGTLIPVGTPTTLTVRYLSGGTPQANRTVSFAATGGALSATSVSTDAGGFASVSIVSSTASPATVQATLAGNVAQATLPVQFVGGTPQRVIVQVSPTALGPNLSGATTRQAQVQAKVVDGNGNPVTGVSVNFDRLADPSGGNLSQASAVTDSSGQASVQYIAGPLSTASNGVRLTATVASDTTITGETDLTVNQSALFIALGTGNQISNLDETTYNKQWVVSVTDSNGIAVSNVNLTIKVLPVSYGKGFLTYNGSSWGRASGNTIECANEDVAYTGILDAATDYNHDGKIQPGNVISVTPGTVTTDATGRALVSVRYAESYSPWVTVTLRAEASVSGTESSAGATFEVEALASDVTDKNVTPAGLISPFGTNLDCTIPN